MSIIIGGEDDDTPLDEHQILYNRGIEYYKEGYYDKAIKYFSAVLKIKPYYLVALYSRGDSYAKKCDYDRAIESWTAVLEFEPKDLYALYSRGLAHYKKDNYDQAINDLETVLKISPNYDNAKQLLEEIRQA